jgi:hypothetical protein
MLCKSLPTSLFEREGKLPPLERGIEGDLSNSAIPPAEPGCTLRKLYLKKENLNRVNFE